MTELGLISGYRRADERLTDLQEEKPSAQQSEQLPQLSFREMLRLGLRTWPYMRPMLKHLIVLGGFALAGMFGGVVTGLVGTDLFTNKVLVGQKLQPLQARVLFLGDDYVTTNPVELGEGTPQSTAKGKASVLAGKMAGKSALDQIKPELTREQRKTVRNRLVISGIVGGVLLWLAGVGVYYYTTWIWQSINQNLRVAMVDRAESLSLKYHNRSRVGDAIFRVYQDSAQIVNLLQSGIISPLITLYGIVVGLLFVAAFDPLFALAAVAVGVPFVWVMVAITPRIRRRASANRFANSDLTSRVQETLSAVKVVKANRAETQVFDRFNRDSLRALDAAYFLRLDMAIASTVVALLGGAFVILSEFVMVTWIIEERETFLGAMVASVIGFTVWNYGAFQIARGRIAGLSGSAGGLLGIWMQMQDLFIALHRAFHLLDLEPEVVDPDDPVPFPAPIERVTWENVAFGYHDDRPVLEGVDLEASAGTVTAVAGTTGAGKSTLMSLLLRLFDPDAGRVSIDGVDLRDMAVEDIRRHTAIALQKNVLFADTVANNIGFGAVNIGRDEIIAAANIACAAEFVSAMENEYDTELGERGGKLSAGQRQRLSIARAVVRDTPILILDEPTASLDAETEQRVLANLAEWGGGRIIFIITHRLSTIKNADQIALLENGRIVEVGSHAELMATDGGRYRAFIEAEVMGAGANNE